MAEGAHPLHVDLIHHVSRLPYKGKDPVTISDGKGSDFALAKAMKMKYKVEKKKRGYTISNIKDKAAYVATQILTGKVMRKCHTDKVPTPVVALAEQFTEGVQFNWSKFLCTKFLESFREAQQ